MTRSDAENNRAITVEHLIALNEEMAALVRAGVPLERGLLELGRDLPGRPGRLAKMLATRMNSGESLLQILESEPEQFPPVWRAVVKAGLLSGRLSAALEAISVTARRVADLRRIVAAALVYPMIVLAFAYGVLLFQVTHLAPVLAGAREDLAHGSDPILAGQLWLGDTAMWWAPWLPLLVVVLLGTWWFRSGRDGWSERSGPVRQWACKWLGLGAIGTSLREGRMAAFAEILSLLVRQKVPLQQAVVLAADASGDRVLRHASHKLADRLQRGDVFRARDDLPREFPPLLGWLLLTGVQQPDLSETLAGTAANYRERAARTATWAAVYLPLALTVFIGGTVVLLQALATFAPIWRLLYDLGQPV